MTVHSTHHETPEPTSGAALPMLGRLIGAGRALMRALVTAASRHGATHEIADRDRGGPGRRGVEADARPAEELDTLDGYDAYVIGSAVYVGRWLEPARGLVETNAAALAARRCGCSAPGRSGRPTSSSRRAIPSTSPA